MKHTYLLPVIFWLSACSNDTFSPPVNCDDFHLSLELDSVRIASGCDISDGKIYVSAFGGKEPYQFSNDAITFQSSGNFMAVKTGIYMITVMDGNGCTAVLGNVSVGTEGFEVTTEVKADSLCSTGNGYIMINVSGGKPPFTYKLENGLFSTNNTFFNLDEGNHHITVKDSSECTADLTITIPHGFTGTSWSQEVLPIIKTDCALSGCHNGTNRPDLRIYEKAKFYAKYIRQYTQDRTMPFDRTLTQQEIDIIACWVDDGALNN